MAERKLTSTEIAEYFDVSPAAITRWVARGCPHDGTGGKRDPRMFDADEVDAWKDANGVTGGWGGARSGPLSEEKSAAQLRILLAKADREEMERDALKKRLVSKEDVEAKWVQIAIIIKNKILALSSAAAPALQGLSVSEIESELDRRFREILVELSKR